MHLPTVPGAEGRKEERLLPVVFPRDKFITRSRLRELGEGERNRWERGRLGGDFGISFSQTRVRFSVTRLRDSDVRLAPLSADTYPVSTHFSPRILTKFPSFDPTTIACETNAVTRHVSFSRAKQRVYPRTKLQRAFSSELRVDFSTFSSHEKRSVSIPSPKL